MNKLKEYRMHADLTKEAVAAALGVDKAVVQAWEDDDEAPNKLAQTALARLYHCEPRDLKVDIFIGAHTDGDKIIPDFEEPNNIRNVGCSDYPEGCDDCNASCPLCNKSYQPTPPQHNFKEGQLIIYRNGDRYELGLIKRLTDNGAFVWYHSGDTAAKTPFDCMFPLMNARYITVTRLGNPDMRDSKDAELERLNKALADADGMIGVMAKQYAELKKEMDSFVKLDEDPYWHPTLSDPDSGGANAGRYYFKKE